MGVLTGLWLRSREEEYFLPGRTFDVATSTGAVGNCVARGTDTGAAAVSRRGRGGGIAEPVERLRVRTGGIDTPSPASPATSLLGREGIPDALNLRGALPTEADALSEPMRGDDARAGDLELGTEGVVGAEVVPEG